MLRQAREADGKLVWIPTYNYVEMFQINGINQNNLEYKRLFALGGADTAVAINKF